MKKFTSWVASAAIAISLAGCGNAKTPVAPSALIDTAPPQAPVGLAQAVDGSHERILNWSHNSEADLASYQVYQYSPDPSRDNAYVLVATVSAATHAWPLPADEGFVVTWMRLRAVDQSGNRSAESAPCQVMFLPDGPGAEPPVEDPPPVRH